jgi:uncharacterized protein YyaL (SSP411 family)
VVAAWNGLAVAGLAEAGALLERPDLVDAASVAADLLLDVHLVDGRLRRVSRDGVVGSRPRFWRTMPTWLRGCSRCTP